MRLEDPSGFPKLGHGVELNHPWLVKSLWMWYLAIPVSKVPIVAQWKRKKKFLRLFSFFFFFFFLFRAAPAAYGSFQARGRIRAVATGLQPQLLQQQLGLQATSATYTTTHGSTGSLTHWARPGIKPTTSWILVGLINHWATAGTPIPIFNEFISRVFFPSPYLFMSLFTFCPFLPLSEDYF